MITFCKTINDLALKSERYLLLIGEKTDISKMIFSDNTVVFGAIFPRVVFGVQSFDSGIVVVQLSDETVINLIENMDDISKLSVPSDTASVFTIVDGLSLKSDDFLDNLYGTLPEYTKMIGGGAGKMTLKQEPVLFYNNTFYQDSALVLCAKKSIAIGVKHGWESIVGPLMATSCDGHMLKMINFKDAFAVYRDTVEFDSDKSFDDYNFFDIAKAYPIGIIRFGQDFIVRDPIFTDGKGLLLVGNIDQNSVIAILKGEKEKLIEAARNAAKVSFSFAKQKPNSTLLIDCISRYLFLEDNFEEELEAVSGEFPADVLLWGMLTLGEVANANQESIAFYNKTCVVGAL